MLTNQSTILSIPLRPQHFDKLSDQHFGKLSDQHFDKLSDRHFDFTQ